MKAFHTKPQRRKVLRSCIIGFCLCLILSCARSVKEPVAAPAELSAVQPAVRPAAILQTGKQPIWFQLTENGPVHIESIEDAVFSAALIPWPFALHVRFFLETENELVMAVNRYGFLKLSPAENGTERLALYRFYGGVFWQQYTAGGFVFFNDKPAVLLYLDDRFLDTTISIPKPAVWTFNMESNTPFPLEIPVFELFSADDGWSADYLRYGIDGLIYYRLSRKIPQPEIRIFRTSDLAQTGNEITSDVFFNSLPRQKEISDPMLPPLPEGFVYTGIGRAGGDLFACWEEQADFSIGAAGFLVMKINNMNDIF